MGIRVKIRLLMEEKGMETAALVNSGFESSEPDICIPIDLAKRMGLWPSLKFESEEASTAGGEVSIFRLPAKAEVQLILNDEVRASFPCNIIVNPYVEEVLLSDYLIDELGIIPISFRKGLWRHRTDNEGVVRRSEEPQYWR